MPDFLEPNLPTPPSITPASPDDGIRHAEAAQPLEEVSGALQSSVDVSIRMDPAVKEKQRSDLISLASKRMQQENNTQPTKKITPRVWWGVGAFATVALAALLVVVAMPSIRPGVISTGSIARITIPEAHAADAFSLSAEKTDVNGLDTDSAFVLKSVVSVNASDLKQHLTIVPAVDFTVEATNDNTYRIQPSSLEPSTVYRLSLPATISLANGVTSERDFSWAFQTKNDFRIISTVPFDGSSGVPANTSVDFKLTQSDWENPASMFKIEPAVKGRFETHGRTLSFLPEKPLAYGTRYTVTLQKGLKLAGSDVALKNDVLIRFETERAASQTQPERPIAVSSEFFEVPGKGELVVGVYEYNDPKNMTPQPDTVQVTGYLLGQTQAKALLEKRLQVPDWAMVEKEKYRAYLDAEKTQTFQLTATIETPEQYGRQILRLPAFARKGFYALKLQKTGRLDTWLFVQVTDIATYMTADKETLLVWTVNAATNSSWNGLPVKTDSGSVTTDNKGIARLPAPSFLTQTNVDVNVTQPSQIVELGSGEDRAFTVVHTNMRYPFFAYGRFDAQNVDTWSYVYTDRPLYHPSDEMKFFGLAQDRNTKKGAGKLQVKLEKEMFIYYDASGFGNAKSYKTVDVETDEAGFFQSQLSWSTLSNGYYRMSVVRDGTVLASRTFEVREFVKPSYGIEVTTQTPRVYHGEPIKGSVRALFYDGTPVPKASLELSTGGEGGKGIHQTLITDDNGYATFQLVAFKQPCTNNTYYYCPRSDRNVITVTPTEGEEGEIIGTASVDVYGSALLLDGIATAKGNVATISYTARHADLTKDDATGAPWAELPLKGEVLPTYWEPIQDGTYFDYEEHKVYPRYRYEQRFEPAIPFTLKTDASGKATYTFTMQKDRQYRVRTEGWDGQSRAFRSDMTVAIGWIGDSERANDNAPYWDPEPILSLDNAKGNPFGYFSIGEHVGVSFLLGTQPLPVTGTPGTLFITSSRGMRKAEVVQASTYGLTFDESIVPNAEIRGIIFRKGHFLSHTVTVQFRRTDRELNIEAAPDHKSYAPGAPVNVNVTVKTKDGKPAAHARVGFGAVDKSLLALSYTSTNEDVLGLLYGYVPSGILFETSSHDQNGSLSAFAGGGGGAEMGGDMRGEMKAATRKNFKDTAAFSVVETDGNGKATLSFQAPDNLTTWRVEMVALTSDLQAGSDRTEVAVTRSVFVDVVAPPRLLATDQPVLKLRAYGTGLPEKSTLTFYVDAPTLGLKDETVTGTAGVPTFVTLKTLPIGRHVVTIGVKSNGKTDAIERTVDVVASRFLKDQYLSVAAAPGASLPALGAPEADVVITSQTRASLVPMLRELSYGGWSARVDRKVAARYATAVLQDQFGIKPESEDAGGSLAAYQSEPGGIHLLPYASDDVEVSAEMAATDMASFDAKAMSAYFWGELDRASDNRSLQIQALSGLASLGEPVLARLQKAAEETDLTWRDELAVARGLMAAGDTERARGVLERLLKKGEERDSVMQIAVTNKPSDRYEATADAAAIAAALAHPKADALRKFVETNWSTDAFPILAKVRYLKATLPRLPSQDVSVSWTLDGVKEETVILKDEPVKYLSLTADEARAFRITKTNGPAEITLITRVSGRPTSVPEVAVSRAYANGHPLDQLQEGDVVRVTLKPEWKETAQDGCYALRDHLPGGWEAVVSWRAQEANVWYPYDVSDGEVSFVVCKDIRPTTITYLARVVSRGSYTAEAPLMQHLQFPSVATVGTDQNVTIK